MGAKIGVDNGRDAVLAARHLTVATKVEIRQRGRLGASARVEHPLLVMYRERHLGEVFNPSRGSLGVLQIELPTFVVGGLKLPGIYVKYVIIHSI